MRKQIFNRARKLIEGNKVKITEETDNSIHFKIGEHGVIFKKVEGKGSFRMFPCTCYFGSINTECMCAGQIAALVYIYNQFSR